MSRIRITNRDESVLEYISNVKVTTAKDLALLFFGDNLRQTQQRLKLLYDNSYVKRFREDHWSDYVYYIDKKPKQWNHQLIFNRLISKLSVLDGCELLKYKDGFKLCDNIICDGLICVKVGNKIDMYIIEIELSKYKTNTINKYKKLTNDILLEKGFKIAPKILLITNKDSIEVDKIKYEVVKVDLELNNINDILK